MTRLARALLPARTLALLRRNAVPVASDLVCVSLYVNGPISHDLRWLLESARFTKGAWVSEGGDLLIFTHAVKTCYPADFPGFAREVVAAMRLARREGRRIEVVRYR